MFHEAEQWLPIDGFPGYEVSDAGQVRNRISGHVLRHKINKRDRHHSVCLFLDGCRFWRQVHRLVLTAFVGPCPNGMEGCHNDGVPGNNHVANLRWDTRTNNHLDQVRHGTHREASKTHCPHGHPYDEENTYRYGRKRQCLTCRNQRNAINNAQRAARR